MPRLLLFRIHVRRHNGSIRAFFNRAPISIIKHRVKVSSISYLVTNTQSTAGVEFSDFLKAQVAKAKFIGKGNIPRTKVLIVIFSGSDVCPRVTWGCR